MESRDSFSFQKSRKEKKVWRNEAFIKYWRFFTFCLSGMCLLSSSISISDKKFRATTVKEWPLHFFLHCGRQLVRNIFPLKWHYYVVGKAERFLRRVIPNYIFLELKHTRDSYVSTWLAILWQHTYFVHWTLSWSQLLFVLIHNFLSNPRKQITTICTTKDDSLYRSFPLSQNSWSSRTFLSKVCFSIWLRFLCQNLSNKVSL